MKKALYSLIVVLLIATSSAFSVTITDVTLTQDDRIIVSCQHNGQPGRHRYILKERNTGNTWYFRAQRYNYPYALPTDFEYNISIERTGNVDFIVQKWIDPYWGPSQWSHDSNIYGIYILPNHNQGPPLSDE